MPELKYPYQNLSIKDSKGEQWDNIPFLDGAYEISNVGRIKSNRRFIKRATTGRFWIDGGIIKLRVENPAGLTPLGHEKICSNLHGGRGLL